MLIVKIENLNNGLYRQMFCLELSLHAFDDLAINKRRTDEAQSCRVTDRPKMYWQNHLAEFLVKKGYLYEIRSNHVSLRVKKLSNVVLFVRQSVLTIFELAAELAANFSPVGKSGSFVPFISQCFPRPESCETLRFSWNKTMLLYSCNFSY